MIMIAIKSAKCGEVCELLLYTLSQACFSSYHSVIHQRILKLV